MQFVPYAEKVDKNKCRTPLALPFTRGGDNSEPTSKNIHKFIDSHLKDKGWSGLVLKEGTYLLKDKWYFLVNHYPGYLEITKPAEGKKLVSIIVKPNFREMAVELEKELQKNFKDITVNAFIKNKPGIKREIRK